LFGNRLANSYSQTCEQGNSKHGLNRQGLYLGVILLGFISKWLSKNGLYLQGYFYSEVAFNTGLTVNGHMTLSQLNHG
jgi:hypothetical protein